jgi:tetratricopeptide (TPR) repeat protein
MSMARLQLLFLVVSYACATQPKRIAIPKHMLASPSRGAGKVRTLKVARQEGAVEAAPAMQPYTLRIVDQGRAYEVSLPPVRGGYEVRIPLHGTEGSDMPELSAERPEELPQDSLEYKRRLIGIRALFARNSFEIASFELAKLLELYPTDEELLAMSGSLEWKRGNKDKAREIWQRVLELNPTNEAVLRILAEEK